MQLPHQLINSFYSVLLREYVYTKHLLSHWLISSEPLGLKLEIMKQVVYCCQVLRILFCCFLQGVIYHSLLIFICCLCVRTWFSANFFQIISDEGVSHKNIYLHQIWTIFHNFLTFDIWWMFDLVRLICWVSVCPSSYYYTFYGSNYKLRLRAL